MEMSRGTNCKQLTSGIVIHFNDKQSAKIKFNPGLQINLQINLQAPETDKRFLALLGSNSIISNSQYLNLLLFDTHLYFFKLQL
jgi:hypothetical protein